MAFEWLIDLMKDWVKLYFKGMIVVWSGAIVDIPDGWALCDGTNGTPDLRGKFIKGPFPPILNPGATGGSVFHAHDFTGDGHFHAKTPSKILAQGTWRQDTDGQGISTGETAIANGEPPYMVLCWIMKL